MMAAECFTAHIFLTNGPHKEVAVHSGGAHTHTHTHTEKKREEGSNFVMFTSGLQNESLSNSLSSPAGLM